MLLFVRQELVILVSDFSAAAVNLPRLSLVGGKWRSTTPPRSSFFPTKRGSVLGPLEQRAQFVRQREEGREGV